MQVLIPISSRTSFFPSEEYFFPKPLIEVAGRPMIELVVNQLKRQLINPKFTFVIDRHVARTFSIDRICELVGGSGTHVIERVEQTSGALCSCLLAIGALDPYAPLLISNSDQIISADLAAQLSSFDRAQVDAGVVTFDSIHPRWSYVVEAANNRVAQTFEKKVVSRRAIAGLYWVVSAHGENFVKTMLRLSETRDALTVVADQIGGPTPARDIAAACLQMVEQLIADPSKSGTYHYSGAPDVSWADFANAIFEQAGKAITVTSIPTIDYPTPAKRPLNSRMDCSATKQVFGIQYPDWRDGLNVILKDLKVIP